MKDFFNTVATPIVIKAIFTAVIALLVANIILNSVVSALEKNQKVNKTIVRFIKPIAKFLVYFFACIIIANSLGFDTSSIVALASVFSAAIALAAQNVLSNLFGGLTLIITHPFNVGDFVTIGGFDGVVDSIGIFYTVLKTLDNKTVTIPNGSVAGASITNYSTEGKRRVDLVITASYDSKIEDVKKAISAAIASTANVDENDQFVRLSNYGASAIEYTVRVWTDNTNYWQVYFDLLENVKSAFDNYGVAMSYNHVVVHNAKD